MAGGESRREVRWRFCVHEQAGYLFAYAVKTKSWLLTRVWHA